MFYIAYGKDDQAVRPLIYCVGNAFPARDRDDYWYYVPALFEDENGGYAGGDPGWLLEGYLDEHGRVMYWARSSTDISGLEPESGDYDEALVKKYFARTMREYARVHPESSAKIQELIDRYQLESDVSLRLIAEGQAPDDQSP